MKIYLIGEFLPGRLETFYHRAFEALGLKVAYFNTAERNKLLRPCWAHILNPSLLREAQSFKPDLVLVFKGFYLWPKTIDKIRQRNRCPVYCLNADNPFNLFSNGASNQRIVSAIGAYDCYFTFSRLLVEKIKKAGAKRAEYLPFGYSPQAHHPVKNRQFTANDVVFVGSWDIEREYWFKELSGFDFGIWGNKYWLKRCKDKRLASKWRGKEAYEEEASLILGSAKISLNALRRQNKGSHNMRTFEAPACGAFVLSEYSAEIEEFFEKEKEIAFFSTFAELKEKLQYYLDRPEVRLSIAEAGYRRCISSGYAYLDRARYILKVFDKSGLSSDA